MAQIARGHTARGLSHGRSRRVPSGAPAALRGTRSRVSPEGREQLNRMADGICGEIVRQLSDTQTKIDGQGAEGGREA